MIEPFAIAVPDAVLGDLADRLARTRWPDQLECVGWGDGVDRSYLESLVAYWRTRFDWRRHEAELNTLPQFRATVCGIGLHFVHVRGVGPSPMPIVLTPGWPSWFAELRAVIPLLTDPARYGGDPADAFDVVIPAIPGYPFSDKPTTRGWGVQRVADTWHALMTDVLGYARFGAHGSDWGASITARLAHAYPASVLGFHVTTASGGTPSVPYPGDRALSESERTRAAARAEWYEREGAYAHVQSTKPQTAGYALNDSPVGLAAEIVDRYRAWSDCGGDIARRFTPDEILCTVVAYWATQSITSSMRLYREYTCDPWTLAAGERIETPCGIASFPADTNPPIREWAKRFYNVVHFTSMPRGGHFPGFEEPELLAEDLRSFFRKVRC